MSPEAKRIKIAEACGWRWESCGHSAWGFWEANGKCAPAVGYTSEATKASLLPDYLSDLNAMHEAEKLAVYHDGYDSDLAFDYLENLVIAADVGMSQSATAAQRAEAFLRTLNLFTE